MADTKISELTALLGADSAPDDILPIVDTSVTITKGITRQELQTYNAGTLTTDVKVLDLSATWNNAGVTFTGLKFNVTDTASNAASLLLDLQVGGTSKFKVGKSTGRVLVDGQSIKLLSQASDSFSSEIKHVGNESLHLSSYDQTVLFLSGTDFSPNVQTKAGYSFGWSSGTTQTQGDLRLFRDAAATLAQRNGTNAQTFRLYNTFTDASNYERLGINWGSNIVSIKPEAAGTGTVRVLHISGLPTSNPGPGILWNNAGTPAIGT